MINFLKGLSKKKMLLITLSAYILYFLFSIVCPVLVVCIKYDLFNKAAESKLQLGGWATILLIVAVVVSMFLLKKAINKISDTRPGGAYFKYTLETISGLILPVIVIIVLRLLKIDFELACGTIEWMCFFYIAAGLLNGLVISFIDRENKIRDGALLDKEKDARRNLV